MEKRKEADQKGGANSKSWDSLKNMKIHIFRRSDAGIRRSN